jgi:hypothetical protein
MATPAVAMVAPETTGTSRGITPYGDLTLSRLTRAKAVRPHINAIPRTRLTDQPTATIPPAIAIVSGRLVLVPRGNRSALTGEVQPPLAGSPGDRAGNVRDHLIAAAGALHRGDLTLNATYTTEPRSATHGAARTMSCSPIRFQTSSRANRPPQTGSQSDAAQVDGR